jgi:hypothetical protein
MTTTLFATTAPASPAALRASPPRWRDGRLVAGVLVLLVSVAIGARVVAAAQDTAPVLVVTADLPAGHVLTRSDLATRDVRLAGAGGRYVAGDQLSAVGGRVLDRAVSAGELLPASAVVAPSGAASEVVPLSVGEQRHPALAAGDLVDVFATFATTRGAEGCVTLPVATGLEVAVDVAVDAGGGSDVVLLHVPRPLVAALVHAGATTTLNLTRHTREGAGDLAGETRLVGGLAPAGTCGAHA